jgi:hypothetical protein
MRDGISGAALPAGFPYKSVIETACFASNCSPCLVGAIKMNETGLNAVDAELQDGCDASTGLMPDGSNCGRGPMQLTSSFPPDWSTPSSNFAYAITQFIMPAWTYWVNAGLQGYDLVRAIAASYNAGIGGAQQGHDQGNVDLYTTGGDYGANALANFQSLVAGTIP